MSEYVFGANILENLTTGMYQDSRVIYREYIQNACDQIDKAVNQGLLDKDEAKIEINLDKDERVILIEDNATGIKSEDFIRTLGNIADSDKRLGENKGFRGIGRLCGLAYCKTLKFKAKYKGEKVISVMTCDAEKMRGLISESESGKKYSAQEVLNKIYKFEQIPADKSEINSHWFKVELININQENFDLLDFLGVKNYLAFNAPVPYQNSFIYRSEIYSYIKEKGFKLDEYNIYIDGEQIFKKYETKHKTSKGEDDILGLKFQEFYDENKTLIAWGWIGVSCFKAVIDKDCLMRGIRLRKDNIQIGNQDTLQKFFKEERGVHYFIGEIFCVSPELIPNSQRDYFNENITRFEFEKQLKNYFEYLYKLYREGSEISSDFSKIDQAAKKELELEEKIKSGDFINNAQREQAIEALDKIKSDAEKAEARISRKKNLNNEITIRIIAQYERDKEPEAGAETEIKLDLRPEQKIKYRTDRLSSRSKAERKLISKIYSIIYNSVEAKTAETIIANIEAELK
ncbi:MAG: ATP-binding protein [Synergistaceae bacterium]|nr:ATP-binding protein [Synergistaceae bacterium]